MISKTQILNTLDQLPENVPIDQLIEHFIFLEKIQKGLEDSKNGNVFTSEEAKSKLNKWLK